MTPFEAIKERSGLTILQMSYRLETSAAWIYQQIDDVRGCSRPMSIKIAEKFPEEMKELGITVEDLELGRMPEDELEAS